MENRRSFFKKSGLFLALTALAIPAFPFLSRRKKMLPENKVITLYVDTSRITNQTINQYSNFGQSPDIANEDFTIDVNVGDTITWQGVSSNAPGTDTVHINKIKHHHGKKIFDMDELAGDGDGNGRNPQKVSRKALYSTTDGNHYKYVLSFTVLNNGVKRKGEFHIDPIIQVH